MLLQPNGIALTLQNGLGNQETLSTILGSGASISQASPTFGATLQAPGVVQLMGEGEIVMSAHPQLTPMAHRFDAAQITIRRETDIRTMQWGKLLVNAAVNPITALLEVPNGELLKNDPAQRLMQQVLDEATRIAGAENIVLPYEDPLDYVNTILTITAGNRSSMLQDLARGAPTEINEINGSLVSLGKKWNIPAPVNQALLLLIQARIAS